MGPYPEETKQQALQMYENGKSMREIGGELDISPATVAHWKNGRLPGPNASCFDLYSEEQIERYAELYAEGIPMRSIAESEGIPFQHLRTMRQHNKVFQDAYESALSDNDNRLLSLTTKAQEKFISHVIKGLEKETCDPVALQNAFHAINKINENMRERTSPSKTAPSFEATVKVSGISKDDIFAMISKSKSTKQLTNVQDIQNIIDASYESGNK